MSQEDKNKDIDNEIEINKDINNKNTGDFERETTEGVETLLGDPKKAVLKLSGPMILALLVNSLYSLIDSIWVSGLGGDALAAVGFVTPIFLIAIGFGNGLGAGATATISRFIGENNQKYVDNTAMHVIILSIIFTAIMSIVVLIFLKPILIFLGAGNTLKMALDYGNIMFGFSFFLIFSTAAYGILRGEGNVKKTTYALILGGVLNVILDPIFIYALNLGVSGAAIATVISLAVVCVLITYWFKKGTYIRFSFKNFKYNKMILKLILIVAIPAGVEMFIIAILAGALNFILVSVSGTDAVAIYSAGWRVVMIALVPLMAVAISVVPIVGAAYGAREFNKLDITENYAIKLGLIIAIIMSVLTFIFAPYISALFTYSYQTASLAPAISDFLKVMCLFYLFVPIGMVASVVFQGLGKGTHSLVLTTIRELLLIVVIAYILAVVLGFGKEGVWWGIVIGNIIGSIIAFSWSKIYIKSLKKIYPDT